MKIWEKGVMSDAKMMDFTVGNDRELDLFLAPYDVQASMAHAQMLGKVGLLEKSEVVALVGGLEEIATEISNGAFAIEKEFEDVHSKLEYLLTERLGAVGKKIHMARSRNDQVLVATHLYLKDALLEIRDLSKGLFDTLMSLAGKYEKVLLPGYTHLQIAMPSSFGLWLSAYAESIIDDLQFLQAAFKMANQNPLGSAAGYGSSFPIDRDFTTEALGFESMKVNVVAAQMGRGKLEKTVCMALGNLAATISKLAMDVCLYSSQNFGFIRFPDHLTTGSSIMPHKKNPDVFELIRAKSNTIQANYGALQLLVNNLPSGYHRDLQMAKGIVMGTVEETKACLEMMHFSIAQMEVVSDILEDPKYTYLFSVDTLNEMVLEGMPFRDAYKALAVQIADGSYQPKTNLNHTHVGSIGNLCLDRITEKMHKSVDW
ncbi:MAG: argininosuccinate lyase [Flavobacteriaceae bacterium]|nr:argininosuccinate lyase [Flavobacteriaceae bacterium]